MYEPSYSLRNWPAGLGVYVCLSICLSDVSVTVRHRYYKINNQLDAKITAY